MRNEAQLLLQRAVNSLRLSIEMFNRPWNEGRAEAVLIFLHHSFEMLLKGVIVQRKGQLIPKGEAHSIPFDTCLRRCHTDSQFKCVSDDQVLTLQIINNLRDEATHYVIEISEPQLYVVAQAGVTLFRDLLTGVFNQQLGRFLPDRVLPVSTTPPTDLVAMLDNEFAAISQLMSPGTRKGVQAQARIRPISIMENVTNGRDDRPSAAQVSKQLQALSKGTAWQSIFPGVAGLRLDADGAGITFNLRFTKDKTAMPIRLVEFGDPTAQGVVALRKLNETDFYSLGFTDVRKKLGLEQTQLLAILVYLRVQENADFYKEIRIGKSRHKRYSHLILKYLEEQCRAIDLASVTSEYKAQMRAAKRAKQSLKRQKAVKELAG